MQLASGPTVLRDFPSSNQNNVQKYLSQLNVDLRVNAAVEDTRETSDGQTELTLRGGEKVFVDFAIPTYGVIPNTSFIAEEYLNKQGYVNVDEYLRLSGLENVYAIGEVSAIEKAQFMVLENQSTYMAKTLQETLAGMTPTPYQKPRVSKLFRLLPDLRMQGDMANLYLARVAGRLGQQELCGRPSLGLCLPSLHIQVSACQVLC